MPSPLPFHHSPHNLNPSPKRTSSSATNASPLSPPPTPTLTSQPSHAATQPAQPAFAPPQSTPSSPPSKGPTSPPRSVAPTRPSLSQQSGMPHPILSSWPIASGWWRSRHRRRGGCTVQRRSAGCLSRKHAGVEGRGVVRCVGRGLVWAVGGGGIWVYVRGRGGLGNGRGRLESG